MFDCIIVGAGPAGSTAAYHLGRRGHQVLLLEQAEFPRTKPCSGGISPAIAQYFDFDLSPAIAMKVEKIRYTWKMDDPVYGILPKPMWIVERGHFDQFLVEQGISKGVEFRSSATVSGIKLVQDHWQVTVNGETLTGKYLIGADGVNGNVAQWLGLKQPKTRPSWLLNVSVPDLDLTEAMVTFEFGMVKNGSMWAFPHPQGYAITATAFIGDPPKTLEKELREFASQYPGTASESIITYPLRLWDGERPLHKERAVLVGEAAAVGDPLSGEGIRPAILTGVKAAEAIDQAINGNANAIKEYSQVIHDHWGHDMVWAGRISGAFYRFPKVAYKAGVKKPIATEIMSKILCGEMLYSDIAGRAIKRLTTSFLPGRG